MKSTPLTTQGFVFVLYLCCICVVFVLYLHTAQICHLYLHIAQIFRFLQQKVPYFNVLRQKALLTRTLNYYLTLLTMPLLYFQHFILVWSFICLYLYLEKTVFVFVLYLFCITTKDVLLMMIVTVSMTTMMMINDVNHEGEGDGSTFRASESHFVSFPCVYPPCTSP